MPWQKVKNGVCVTLHQSAVCRPPTTIKHAAGGDWSAAHYVVSLLYGQSLYVLLKFSNHGCHWVSLHKSPTTWSFFIFIKWARFVVLLLLNTVDMLLNLKYWGLFQFYHLFWKAANIWLDGKPLKRSPQVLWSSSSSSSSAAFLPQFSVCTS